jgi:hypothetical protein
MFHLLQIAFIVPAYFGFVVAGLTTIKIVKEF